MKAAKLQKEIRTKINQESTVSWEKFCNSISLESDPKKSWRKITNFLKPKGPRRYPTLKSGNKTAKTNPEKAQLFAESVERNLGIESHLFSNSQFDRIITVADITQTLMNALTFAHLKNQELQNLFETGSDKLKSIIKNSELSNHLKQIVPYFQQAVPGSNYYVEDEFNSHINKINSKLSAFHLNVRSLNCHHK